MSRANDLSQSSRRWPQVVCAVAIGYWLLLFIATHLPGLPKITVATDGDKYLHFAAFFGLTVLLAYSIRLRGVLSWRTCLGLLGVLALYGAVDEISQPLVHRSCEVYDWVADMAGALAGLATVLTIDRLVSGQAKAKQD